jgi:hypothetical protein
MDKPQRRIQLTCRLEVQLRQRALFEYYSNLTMSKTPIQIRLVPTLMDALKTRKVPHIQAVGAPASANLAAETGAGGTARNYETGTGHDSQKRLSSQSQIAAPLYKLTPVCRPLHRSATKTSKNVRPVTLRI